MHRDNRLSDGSPKSDIRRRNVISRPSEAALSTPKFISGWPISLRDITAIGACSGCVSRINKDHGNTRDLCFVIRKHPKQPKIPGVQATMLSIPNRSSLSNTFEIFKSYRPESVFGFRNYLLGNAMVHVFGKSCHSTRKLLQMSLGRLGAFALESGFERIKPVSGLVDLLSRMDFSIRVNCKIFNSKIDTKNAFRIIRSLFRHFDHNAKVENAFDKYQVGLASDPIHSGLLVFSDSNWNKLSTFQSSQGYGFKSLPGKNPRIIDDSTIKLKFWLNRLVAFIGFGNFRDGSNRELRREAKPFSDVVIDCFVDLNLVGLMHLESHFCNAITGFIEAMHSIQKHLILLLTGVQFDHQGLKHYIEEDFQLIYSFRYRVMWSVPNSSRPLKGAGLLGDSL